LIFQIDGEKVSKKVLLQTDYKDLKLFKRGKVRDIYEVDDNYLIISSDRISAFDVIMNEGIPYKGQILTEISKFWFEFSEKMIDNHLISTDVNEFPEEVKKYSDDLTGRTMLVKKAELIPLECIVRGFISGSGWKDYQKSGSICGINLPAGMVESEKISEPIFTPSTKADIGDHDENISENKAIDLVGKEVYDTLKEKSLDIYKAAYEYALEKGIIIADTKMEFGFYNGKIILIDELLTPDSSRFWRHDKYEKGRSQESFDKQYVRDYLLSIKFNKEPPAPELPEEVITNTSKKYKEALDKLTGE
jgi:phosphoribosylaminoimidazole-succinocarboxamide synthase